jgi:hypothetical protein
MPEKLEKIFEKEYGKRKGDLIFHKWGSKHHKHMDYCPHCKKRREHVKFGGIKLCKTCGRQEKMTDFSKF